MYYKHISGRKWYLVVGSGARKDHGKNEKVLRYVYGRI